MSINAKEFNQRSFLDKISSHKLAIIIITLLSVLMATIYINITDKLYSTKATLEVSPKYNFLSQNNQGKTTTSPYQRHIGTQIDFLKSRTLINSVINKYPLNIEYYEKSGIGIYKTTDTPSLKIEKLIIKDPSFYGRIIRVRELQKDKYEVEFLPSSKIKQFLLNMGLIKHNPENIFYFTKTFKNEFIEFSIQDHSNVAKSNTYFKPLDKDSVITGVLKRLIITSNSDASNMLKIFYADVSAARAANFVNILISEYIKINSNIDVAQTEKFLKITLDKLQQAKIDLDASEKNLQQFKKQNIISGLDIQERNTVNFLYNYKQKLEQLYIKRDKLNSIYNRFVKTQDYKEILANSSDLNNAGLLDIIKDIQADKKKYSDLRQKYSDLHPDVKKIQRNIYIKLRALKNNLWLMKISLNKEIIKTSTYLKKYKSSLKKLPEKEINYEKLKREHNRIEKNYLFLLNKKTEIELSMSQQGLYNYRIIDYANVEKEPAKPKKGIIFALSLIFGLIFGILYALMREYFSNKIKIPSEIEELTNLPLLGTVPFIESKKLYNSLFVSLAPGSIASQIIWSLRAGIDAFTSTKKSKVIAITSIIKGEGKTTLSANLATALGMGDKKTIVISFDLRLPELHQKFNLPNNQGGIASVIFGDKDLSDVIFTVKNIAPNLHIVPSGIGDFNPSEIINSNKIDPLLSRLRETYDYIILDLPPIGLAAEAIYLSSKSDLIVCVLKANYSEKRFIRYMEKISSKYKLENVAFVLNSVSKRYTILMDRKENVKYLNQNRYLNEEENIYHYSSNNR